METRITQNGNRLIEIFGCKIIVDASTYTDRFQGKYTARLIIDNAKFNTGATPMVGMDEYERVFTPLANGVDITKEKILKVVDYFIFKHNKLKLKFEKEKNPALQNNEVKISQLIEFKKRLENVSE